jgi:hypothetical protein
VRLFVGCSPRHVSSLFSFVSRQLPTAVARYLAASPAMSLTPVALPRFSFLSSTAQRFSCWSLVTDFGFQLSAFQLSDVNVKSLDVTPA